MTVEMCGFVVLGLLTTPTEVPLGTPAMTVMWRMETISVIHGTSISRKILVAGHRKKIDVM
jgi:hypothetical protein